MSCANATGWRGIWSTGRIRRECGKPLFLLEKPQKFVIPGPQSGIRNLTSHAEASAKADAVGGEKSNQAQIVALK